MSQPIANNFIDFINQHIDEKLDSPLEPSFSFMGGPQKGMFTIVKKSPFDPLKTVPVAQFFFVRNLEYLDPAQVAAEICESFSKAEFKYFRDER